MGASRKAALGGADHRDGHIEQISGPWFSVLDAGADPPDDPDAVEDEDYVYLQNGWAQPADPLEPFSFRRGLSQLDFTGHLDSAGASSGTVAFAIPAAYRLPMDKVFSTVIYDSGTMDYTVAMVYVSASTGDVTITFPAVT